MASISAPTQLLTFGSTGQTASSVFASSANLVAGRLYVIFCGATLTAKTASSVSGSSSSWTCESNGSSARALSYAWTVASTTETVTLTVNWGDATSGGTTMRLVEVVSSNGWPASPRDKLPASNNGSVGDPTFPASGTLAQASEIAFPFVVAAGSGSSSLTPTGSTFTNVGTWKFDGSTNGQQAGYSIRSSTSTYTATGTLASAFNWRAGLITFRDNAFVTISGSVAGTSSLTGTVVPFQRFSASVAGTSSLTGTVVPFQRFSASVAGTSSLTGTVVPFQRFSASVAGTSSLAGTVVPFQRFSASVAGTSSLAGTVTTGNTPVTSPPSGGNKRPSRRHPTFLGSAGIWKENKATVIELPAEAKPRPKPQPKTTIYIYANVRGTSTMTAGLTTTDYDLEAVKLLLMTGVI